MEDLKNLSFHTMKPSGFVAMTTGHRDIFGYDLKDPRYNFIREFLKKMILTVKERYPECSFVSGMALGIDTIFAELVIEQGLDLYAYIPYLNQADRWREPARARWLELLKLAKSVHITDRFNQLNPRYAPYKRNENMIADSDLVIGVFDLQKQSGGTFGCLQNATKTGRHIILYDPIVVKKIYDSWKSEFNFGGVKTYDYPEAYVQVQKWYAKNHGCPVFISDDGICYRCHKNIFVNGYSFSRARDELITGCPHCFSSFDD